MNETNLSPRMATMSTRTVSLAWRALQPRPRERRGAVNFEVEVDNVRSLWLSQAPGTMGARRRADRPRDNTGIRRDALMR